jgi:hypothetical protein
MDYVVTDAVFEGPCAGCPRLIEPGDKIARDRDRDGVGGWHHLRCYLRDDTPTNPLCCSSLHSPQGSDLPQ